MKVWCALVQETCRRMGGGDILRSSSVNRTAHFRVPSLLDLRMLVRNNQLHTFSVRANTEGVLIVVIVYRPSGHHPAQRSGRMHVRWANQHPSGIEGALELLKLEECNSEMVYLPSKGVVTGLRLLTRDHIAGLCMGTIRVHAVMGEDGCATMELLVQE